MGSLMLLGAGGPAGGSPAPTLIFTGTADPQLSGWTVGGTANLTQGSGADANNVYCDVPGNLTSLNILPASAISGEFTFSAGFSNLTTFILDVSNFAYPDITSVNISGCTAIANCQAEYCALTVQSDVDGIIAACLASAQNGNTGGTLLLDGGTNATPSSTGLTNVGLLQSTYSWSVSTN